jgi:hypothetical protein
MGARTCRRHSTLLTKEGSRAVGEECQQRGEDSATTKDVQAAVAENKNATVLLLKTVDQAFCSLRAERLACCNYSLAWTFGRMVDETSMATPQGAW